MLCSGCGRDVPAAPTSARRRAREEPSSGSSRRRSRRPADATVRIRGRAVARNLLAYANGRCGRRPSGAQAPDRDGASGDSAARTRVHRRSPGRDAVPRSAPSGPGRGIAGFLPVPGRRARPAKAPFAGTHRTDRPPGRRRRETAGPHATGSEPSGPRPRRVPKNRLHRRRGCQSGRRSTGEIFLPRRGPTGTRTARDAPGTFADSPPYPRDGERARRAPRATPHPAPHRSGAPGAGIGSSPGNRITDAGISPGPALRSPRPCARAGAPLRRAGSRSGGRQRAPHPCLRGSPPREQR